MTSSNPNYLPKAPSPNTITLGVRALTYEFGGNTVQCISLFLPEPWREILISLVKLRFKEIEDVFLSKVLQSEKVTSV